MLLILSWYLFFNRRSKEISTKLLGGFLFSYAMQLCGFLAFGYVDHLMIKMPHLFLIGDGFWFLIGPFLYLFIHSIIFKNFRIKKTHLIHVLPFVGYYVYTSIRFHFQTTEKKISLLATQLALGPEQGSIVFAFIFALLLGYSFYSLYLINIYKSNIQERYSLIDDKGPVWLRVVITGFIISFIIDAVNTAINKYGIYPTIGYDLFNGISISLVFVLSVYLVYKGLSQPLLLTDIEEKGKKYESSRLSGSEQKVIVEQLESMMKIKKPYLNPNLNLKELADMLGVPSRHLSQSINETFGKNFFDYINSYRIEEAKSKLRNQAEKKKTVLEVMYEVGFNSKSVFNTTFKKLTEQTPTEFRRDNKM